MVDEQKEADRRDHEERRDILRQRKWHFDRTINIGTITAILTSALLVSAYIMKQDARLTTVEVRMDSQSAAMVTIAGSMRDATRDLQTEVRQLRADMMQFLRDANRRENARGE